MLGKLGNFNPPNNLFINNIVKEAILFNDQDSMQYLSKIIAMHIRKELTDRHNYKTEVNAGLMANINKSINDGIYNALYILSNSFNNIEYFKELVYTQTQIPRAWENPVLSKPLENNLSEIEATKIRFKSAFLNQHFEIGNIYKMPNSLFIRCELGSDFQETNPKERKKILSKIYSDLKKEGYTYDPCRDAYVKFVSINDML